MPLSLSRRKAWNAANSGRRNNLELSADRRDQWNLPREGNAPEKQRRNWSENFINEKNECCLQETVEAWSPQSH